MRKVVSALKMVCGQDFVEEFGDRDVVAVEIFGHSDSIFLLEELGNSDIIGVKELSDGLVEELGHRDVVLVQELCQAIIYWLFVQEFSHCDIVRCSKVFTAPEGQPDVELGSDRVLLPLMVTFALMATVSVLVLALPILSVLLVMTFALMATVSVLVLALPILRVPLVVTFALVTVIAVLILALPILSVLLMVTFALMAVITVLILTLSVLGVLLSTKCPTNVKGG